MMQSVYYSFRKVTCTVTCTITCTEVMFDTYTTSPPKSNTRFQEYPNFVSNLCMMEFTLLCLSSVHYSSTSLWGGLIVLFDRPRIFSGGDDTGGSVLLIDRGGDGSLGSSMLFAGE